MKWKKILKYALVIFFVLTIIMIFLANRNMTQIYGGLTKQVDHDQFEPTSGPILIKNINILSPDGTFFIPKQNVLVENGKIVSIDTLMRNAFTGETIDGLGKYLIPGLTDTHVHLFKSPNDLLLYVANGVTQIRELIGSQDILKWKKEIEKGRIGPDMYVASKRIGSFGTLEGWFMAWSQMFLNAKNASEGEELVKELYSKGYDAVKVYSHLNKETYLSINKTAKSLGMDVVGHIPWSVDFRDIIDAHQSDIAHLEEVMNAFRREFGRIDDGHPEQFLQYVVKRSNEISMELIKNDISVTTTLWLTQSFVRQKFELDIILREVELEYENPGISEWYEPIPQGLGWLPEVNRYRVSEQISADDLEGERVFWNTYGEACKLILTTLSNNGVTILAGTDANLPPTVPGFSLHNEFESMVDAGMSPAAVLQSTTSVPAERLRFNTGKIEVGRKANLVMLEKNPLLNIRNTKSINAVFLNGNVFSRSVLDQMLEAVKEANDASRKRNIDEFL